MITFETDNKTLGPSKSSGLATLVYHHIPKTGGQVLTDSLSRLWLPNRRRQQHSIYCQPDNPNLPYVAPNILNKPATSNLTFFTFVREPLEWYRSYYFFRVRTGWSSTARPSPQSVMALPERSGATWPLDNYPHTPQPHTFPRFLQWALDSYPQYVTRLFSLYTSPFGHRRTDALEAGPDKSSNSNILIGATERLWEHTSIIGKQFGFEHNIEKLAANPNASHKSSIRRNNVTRWPRSTDKPQPYDIPRDLHLQLVAEESAAYDLWYDALTGLYL